MTNKEARKTIAYRWAINHHDQLMVAQNGMGIAYRRGYLGGEWEANWITYPLFVAGQDNRKIIA